MALNHQEKMTQAKIESQKKWRAEKAKFIAENDSHIANYFRGLPDTCKKLWHRCFTAKSSGREAIKAKCYDCSGYNREEIKNCTVRTCPLWNYRPFKKGN